MILGRFVFHLSVSRRSLQPTLALVCLCWLGCFLLFSVGELNFDLFLTSLTATVESNAATEKKKLCESCIRAIKLNAWALAPWSRPLCDAYTANDDQNQLSTWAQDWDVQPAHVVVCRARGCGDNTIGHWTGWCVVPLIVAIAILKPTEREMTLVLKIGS